jgi:hypothetical protein
MAGTARRVMRLLQKRGLQDEDDPLAEDDPLLATLMAASVRSRIATGPEAGQPWHRLGDRVEPIEPDGGGTIQKSDAPPRCVREGGMSLHADITIPAHDRMRLERLSRYILRPPVTLDRLEAQPDGRLAYRLKTPWRDGTTHILMERHELLERLAPLIPPPRLTRPAITEYWHRAPAEGVKSYPLKAERAQPTTAGESTPPWRQVGAPMGPTTTAVTGQRMKPLLVSRRPPTDQTILCERKPTRAPSLTMIPSH